jgi:hypothetical protein
MMTQASQNSWSELLTSPGNRQFGRLRVFSNVSNPAQHRPCWSVMVDLLAGDAKREFWQNAFQPLWDESAPASGRAKEYGKSSIQRSFSQMRPVHYRCIRQAIFTTQATGS